MRRTAAMWKLVLALVVTGAFAQALPSFAGGGNGNQVIVPTLDGIGLATLGGAVAMAGAWLVSRRRNRE